MLENYFTPHLERAGDFVSFHAEWLGQEAESLDLFVVGQVLLQGVDAFAEVVVNLWVVAEFFQRFVGDGLLFSVFLQQGVGGYSQG